MDKQELEDVKHFDKTLKAPMKYPGGKFDLVDEILPYLPIRKGYVEPFGGSGVMLLNRKPVPLEVYNDKSGGLVAFYRVLRTRPADLINRLDMTVHSREEWNWCHATQNDPTLDEVEKAARWYYCLQNSFGGKGQSFGRIVSPANPVARVLRDKLPLFWNVHFRFKNVQVENLDWELCLQQYDHPDTVFYLDPPYYKTDITAYAHKMTSQDHIRMLETIMRMKGFVALSGYPNDTYNMYKWDNVVSFPRRDNMNYDNGLKKAGNDRGILTEMLWIKEAR